MTRDAVLPILCLLSMAREAGSRVSDLRQRLPPRFTASDRLQSSDRPKQRLVAPIRDIASGARNAA